MLCYHKKNTKITIPVETCSRKFNGSR